MIQNSQAGQELVIIEIAPCQVPCHHESTRWWLRGIFPNYKVIYIYVLSNAAATTKQPTGEEWWPARLTNRKIVKRYLKWNWIIRWPELGEFSWVGRSTGYFMVGANFSHAAVPRKGRRKNTSKRWLVMEKSTFIAKIDTTRDFVGTTSSVDIASHRVVGSSSSCHWLDWRKSSLSSSNQYAWDIINWTDQLASLRTEYYISQPLCIQWPSSQSSSFYSRRRSAVSSSLRLAGQIYIIFDRYYFKLQR